MPRSQPQLVHTLTYIGRRNSRHNRRYFALSTRHPQNPASIIRRLLGIWRLSRYLQWYWISDSRIRAWGGLFFCHVRRCKDTVRCEKAWRLWRGWSAHACSKLRRSGRVCCPRTHGGCQAKGTGEAASIFAVCLDIYPRTKEDAWLSTRLA